MINKVSILNGAKCFSLGIISKYIKYSGTTPIELWKSEENIENITKPDSNFVPTFVAFHILAGINLNRHCLIIFLSQKK